MTLTLTVAAGWWDHVLTVARTYPHLVPVVKGNGYGFGRNELAHVAAALLADRSDDTLPATVAVGTVHELAAVADLAAPVRIHVLTPALATEAAALATHPAPVVATIAAVADVAPLAAGGVVSAVIKLRSSMRRFGVAADELVATLAAAADAGVIVEAAAIHLPLATDDAARRAEIDAWLAVLEPHAGALGHALWLSHLSAKSIAELATTWPDWTFVMRSGSALWHGDKRHLHLGATVRAVHDIAAGESAGYHHTIAPADGHLVIIGAGTAHGVTALPDGRSPFHFERRRLPLLEAPHMHSSVVFVAADDRSVPPVGATVDVQRPLTAVAADTVSYESPPPTR